MCDTIRWRDGILVCKHSVPKYERLASITGASFRVTPINGVKSTLDKSGGTHSLYGACDFEGDGYTKAEVYSASNLARACMLLSWPRLWSGPNWHIHTGDPECPQMAATLKAQFELLRKNLDGLVTNGTDPGSRQYVPQIMALYDRYGKIGKSSVVATGTTTPVVVKKPIIVKASAFPGASAKHFPIRLDAVVSPAVAGIAKFQYLANGVWVTHSQKPLNNGRVQWTNLTPGYDATYRILVTPTDTKNYNLGTSNVVKVPVVDLVALRSAIVVK